MQKWTVLLAVGGLGVFVLAGCGSSGSGSGSGTGGAGAAAGAGGSGATGGGSGGKAVNCGQWTADTCLCSLEDTGNANECSPTKNSGGGFCCAVPGWPAEGDCRCGPILCNSMGGSCMCGAGLFSSGDPSCTGTYCCLDGLGGCNCGPDACGSGETQVPVCDSTTFACGTGTVKVDKCR